MDKLVVIETASGPRIAGLKRDSKGAYRLECRHEHLLDQRSNAQCYEFSTQLQVPEMRFMLNGYRPDFQIAIANGLSRISSEFATYQYRLCVADAPDTLYATVKMASYYPEPCSEPRQEYFREQLRQSLAMPAFILSWGELEGERGCYVVLRDGAASATMKP